MAEIVVCFIDWKSDSINGSQLLGILLTSVLWEFYIINRTYFTYKPSLAETDGTYVLLTAEISIQVCP